MDSLHRLLNETFDELFPLLRSLTGEGLEESLRIMSQHIPLERIGVASGTRVFDWEVPPVWTCRSATLTGPDGRVICDLRRSNLEVLNYSAPIDTVLSLEELQSHLYSLPELPEATPYVTSYYKRNWGFCLPHSVRNSLEGGLYHARVDSDFRSGELPLAHYVLPGETDREVMLSSYLCHPSLANNELSGPLVLLGLYEKISRWPSRKFSYRFVLNPETIGSICYLHRYGEHLVNNLHAGLVLTCLGGPNKSLSYKCSRRQDAPSDDLARHWAETMDSRVKIREFTPCSGSDERQYCSPGFNLPVGQFARTVYGEYDGYHNSLDNKEWMGIESLVDSVELIEQFLVQLEYSGKFWSATPWGEPQLGKRGLYPNINSAGTWCSSADEVFDGREVLNRLLMVLNYSDGLVSMVDIARKCGCRLSELIPVVRRLEEAGLLLRSQGDMVGARGAMP